MTTTTIHSDINAVYENDALLDEFPTHSTLTVGGETKLLGRQESAFSLESAGFPEGQGHARNTVLEALEEGWLVTVVVEDTQIWARVLLPVLGWDNTGPAAFVTRLNDVVIEAHKEWTSAGLIGFELRWQGTDTASLAFDNGTGSSSQGGPVLLTMEARYFGDNEPVRINTKRQRISTGPAVPLKAMRKRIHDESPEQVGPPPAMLGVYETEARSQDSLLEEIDGLRSLAMDLMFAIDNLTKLAENAQARSEPVVEEPAPLFSLEAVTYVGVDDVVKGKK